MNSDKVIFNKVSNPPFRHHQHLSKVLFGFIICEESFKRVFSSSLNLFWGIPEHVFFKRGAIQYSEIQNNRDTVLGIVLVVCIQSPT